MRRILSILLFAAGAAVLCQAQVSLTGWSNIQYTDQSGRALSAGKVFSCAAGLACPGNPIPTYTTSSGSVAHTNPITLDSSGRPPGGQIWLTQNVAYKIVVTNAAGAVITGAGGDNITGGSGGGGGGGGGDNWTLSGANIFNANAGNVGVGTSSPEDKLHVSGNLLVGTGGVLKLRNADLTPHFVGQVAPPGMASDITLTWPGALPGAIGCMKMSTAGVISIDAACSAAPTDTIWSIDVDNNVTLADSMTKVSALTFQNLTAGTGVTAVVIKDGAGQAMNYALQFQDPSGAFTGGFYQGGYVTSGDIFISPDGSNQGVLSFAVSGVSKFAWYEQNDGSAIGLARYDGGGVYVADAIAVDRATGNTSIADLFVTNATCSGTCTGFGGGGSSPPFSDTTSIVKGNITASKQMRFDVETLVSAASVRSLTVQNASYVIAGTNIAQTISGVNTFTSNILASGTPNIGSTTAPFSATFATAVFGEGIKIATPGSLFAAATSLEQVTPDVFRMRDAAGAVMQDWTKTLPAFSALYANFLPAVTNTYSLGLSAFRWSKLWVTDLDISGTCTGAGCPGTGGGANTSLSNLGAVAVNADLNPGASLARSIGSPTFQWNHVYSNALHTCDTFAGNCWGIQSIPGLGGLVFAGPSGNRFILAPNGTSTIQGASSGALFPLLVADSGGTPGINFYRSTNVKAGSILAGVNSPFNVLNQSDASIFTTFQNGHVQVGTTTDQGRLFFVNGDAQFNGTTYVAFAQLSLVGSSVIAPSGAFGAGATFSCVGGQAVKTITVSGGLVTGATCGAP